MTVIKLINGVRVAGPFERDELLTVAVELHRACLERELSVTEPRKLAPWLAVAVGWMRIVAIEPLPDAEEIAIELHRLWERTCLKNGGVTELTTPSQWMRMATYAREKLGGKEGQR